MPRTPPAPASRAIRLAGGLVVLGFLALVARFRHPVYGFTAFFQLDASNDEVKLAVFHEYPVYVYRHTGGYDGLYYAQIAHDPTLRDPALGPATDALPYRARRILPPAVAWLVAAGKPAHIIMAYSLLNVVAWLALAVLLWRGLPVKTWTAFVAWAGVLCSAGALASVRLALTDLPAAALVALGILAAERGRKFSALGSIAAAGLARETALLGVAGLVKAPWLSWKNAARIVLAATPLALWLGYIRWRLGGTEPGWGNFTWPLLGWVEKWVHSAAALADIPDLLLASSTLLTVFALSVQALFLVTKVEICSRWWRVGAINVALMAALGTAVWEGHPGAATRVLLPLTVAFNVIAARTRASIVWLLLGNLTVFSGLLAWKEVPPYPAQLAADRSGSQAAIAREGAGWYGIEESARHVWLWAERSGAIELETWPKSRVRVQVRFEMRALDQRTVTARVAGQPVWSASIGTARSSHVFELELTGGRGTIEFHAEKPPVHDPAADPRALGFALYDLHLEVKEP